MNPDLALLLCCAFCISILCADGRWNPASSSALWIPAIWMMRCFSRNVGYWFAGGSTEGVASIGAHDQLLFLALTLAGWGVLVRRRIDLTAIFHRNGWVFVFYAYMLISVLWSPDQFISFKRWTKTFGDLTMALVIATDRKPFEAIMTVMRRCVYLLIPLSVTLVKYFPALGKGVSKHWEPRPWIGVATHKNTLGQLCLVAALALMWMAYQRWNENQFAKKQCGTPWIVLAIYTLMTLWLFNAGGHSRSITSILVLLFGLVSFWALGHWRANLQKLWSRLVLFLTTVFLLSVGSQAMLNRSLPEVVLNAMGKNTTLSDRTMLWEDCIKIGSRYVLVGAGYGGFWTAQVHEEINVRNTNSPGQAHNGYIEIYLHLGLLGGVLFVMMALQALTGAWRLCRSDFEHGRLKMTALLVILLHNLAESGFARPIHVSWMVFLLAALATTTPAARIEWPHASRQSPLRGAAHQGGTACA